MNPIFVGPIAPERNPPIQPQDYKPKVFVIDQIVPINDEFTGVVTDIDNDFVVGQIIRFVIPKRDGMQPPHHVHQAVPMHRLVHSMTFF